MGKKIVTLAISLLAVLALLLVPCAAGRPVPGMATAIDRKPEPAPAAPRVAAEQPVERRL